MNLFNLSRVSAPSWEPLPVTSVTTPLLWPNCGRAQLSLQDLEMKEKYTISLSISISTERGRIGRALYMVYITEMCPHFQCGFLTHA